MANELVAQEELDGASLEQLAALKADVIETQKATREANRARVRELKEEMAGLVQPRAKRGEKAENGEAPKKKKKKRNRE